MAHGLHLLQRALEDCDRLVPSFELAQHRTISAEQLNARNALVEARALASDLKVDPTLIQLQRGLLEIRAGDCAGAEKALSEALPRQEQLSPHDCTALLRDPRQSQGDRQAG